MFMRKILILAAAATILAACTQDTLMNNVQESEQPTSIGFTSFSTKTSKGDPLVNTNLEFYHNSFVVYGTKQSVNDATDIQYVFGGKATAAGIQDGVTCTYQTTPDAVLGDWKYTDPRYWDKQANYDFIGYAPASDANPLRYYYSAAKAQVGDAGNEFKTKQAYILTGTNLMQGAPATATKLKGFTGDKDLDLMVVYAANAQAGATHDNPVNLEFHHILSKLNVSFAKAESLDGVDITITSVEIEGFKDKGKYQSSKYSYTSDPKVSGWTASYSADPSTYKLSFTGSQALNNGTYQDLDNDPTTPDVYVKGDPYFLIESLVMPQTIAATGQVKITIKYTYTSGSYSEDLSYTDDIYDIAAALHQYFDGYSYNLNFTFDPTPIKFDASVAVWADQVTVDYPIY